MILQVQYLCSCGRYMENDVWKDSDILKKLYFYRLSKLNPPFKKIQGELCDKCRERL
jgi:hypothetical protein